MKVSIGKKVGFSLTVMALLVLLTGLAGLQGINNLSNTLAYLTGPAWDTADGAMEGTIEIEAEVIALQDTLLGAIDSAAGLEKMSAAAAGADEALERMISAGLLLEGQTGVLNEKIAAFRSINSRIIDIYQQRLANEKRAGEILADLNQEMGVLEDQVETNMDDNALLSMTPFEIQRYWDIADALMETRIGMLTAAHALSMVTRGGDHESYVTVMESGLTQAEEEIAALENIRNVVADKLKDASGIDKIRSSFDEYRTAVKEALDSYRLYKQEKMTLDGVIRELLDVIAEIEESADGQVEGQMDNIASTISFANTLVTITIILGLLIAAAGTLVSFRFLVKPIRDVANALHDIAERGGDLTRTIPVKGSDETADLARGFNAFIGRTREIISEVKQASDNVAHEALTLTSIISETSQGANSQKGETEQVASAVTEMVATVSSVAGHASNAADISNRAGSSARNGSSLVKETSHQINRLAQDMQQASETINQLHSNTETIGGVLDVIKTIAEQTNLLALNAAIEAARAGEQGRGFAVVADEVRTLASRTQESTTEIEAMIENLQQGAQKAVQVISSSQAQTEKTTVQAAEVEKAIDQIVEAVNEILTINQQIAVATTEQESASNLIGQNAQTIHTIAEQTASKASQAENSTRLLQDESARMQQSVARFVV